MIKEILNNEEEKLKFEKKTIKKLDNCVYQNIHKKNLEFFSGNDSTGNKQIDSLISSCTAIEPKKRPSAE